MKPQPRKRRRCTARRSLRIGLVLESGCARLRASLACCRFDEGPPRCAPRLWRSQRVYAVVLARREYEVLRSCGADDFGAVSQLRERRDTVSIQRDSSLAASPSLG